MIDVFLSYAHGDDEPFVKRLYENLVAHGLTVWWDQVSMSSRALTFLQEVRDAIDSAGRLCGHRWVITSWITPITISFHLRFNHYRARVCLDADAAEATASAERGERRWLN